MSTSIWSWIGRLCGMKNRPAKPAPRHATQSPLIEQLSKGSGKVQVSSLLELAQTVSQEEFSETVSCASLVGSAIRDGQIGQVFSASHGTSSFQTFVFKSEEVQALLQGSTIENSIFLLRNDPSGKSGATYTQFCIGRAKQSDIRIVDFAISRTHARIEIHADGFIIRDCNSRNGTLVNGTKISAYGHRLADGDTVTLGRYDFAFLTPRSLYAKLTARQQ